MEVVDTGIRNWTIGKDLHKVRDRLPRKHQPRLSLVNRAEEPIEPLSGTLMATLPWYHAYWNEDAPDAEHPEDFGDKVASPEWVDEQLAERDVDTGILSGHEIRFLPGLLDPDYQAHISSIYNEFLTEKWLPESERMKGGIVVTPADSDAAVEQIRQYADHEDVVTVIMFDGGQNPLGDERVLPIYEEVSRAGLPLTIYTSENPVHRQTALGTQEHYVTRNVTLVQNHAANLANMILNGVFEEFPDLEVIWAGEGVGWSLHSMWRATRYFREFRPLVPYDLPKKPETYVKEQCYFTTYPLGIQEDESREALFDMVGSENILFASGYPLWDHDSASDLDKLPEDVRSKVFSENAKAVYGL